MHQETRWYLIEAAMNARARGISDSFTRRHALSHFAGVLAGFRYQRVISQAEEETWNRKMISALGWTPPDLAPAGTSQFTHLPGDDLPSVEELDCRESLVLRSLPGSRDVVDDYHGSSFRVTGIDIGEATTAVKWSVSPEPDIPSLFREDFDVLEADLEDVDRWAADELRKKARDAFVGGRVYVFRLTDDVGTAYRRTRHMWHSRSEVATGVVTFRPAVPDTASELVLTWHEVELSVPMI
jgi:hypothetical protein